MDELFTPEFYTDRGYTAIEAETYVLRERYNHQQVELTPPSFPGWKAVSVRFNFQEGKLAWMLNRGNKWQLVTPEGRRIYGPDLLAPVVFWAVDQKWNR